MSQGNNSKSIKLETYQNHVTSRNVHVGVGGLLAPGGDAAAPGGADGRAAVAELRRDAVDPGGNWLGTIHGRFDRHTLPTELLQNGG